MTCLLVVSLLCGMIVDSIPLCYILLVGCLFGCFECFCLACLLACSFVRSFVFLTNTYQPTKEDVVLEVGLWTNQEPAERLFTGSMPHMFFSPSPGM